MELTMDQFAITELQEELGTMYNARRRDRKDHIHNPAEQWPCAACLDGQTIAVLDDPILSAITEAQRALDAVYAAYS